MKKYLHFYFNKYVLRIVGGEKYTISISFKRKALWYRVAKVGTRTIKKHLEEDADGNIIYSPEGPYISKIYDDYFKFAFVREPIDRFISGWKDKVLERNYYHFAEEEHEEMKDLDNFIDWVEEKDISTCDEHIREQVALIDLEQVDFIGKFENFSDDLEHVLEQLDIEADDILHENRTKKKEIELTKDQERRIRQIYENDYLEFYPEIWQQTA